MIQSGYYWAELNVDVAPDNLAKLPDGVYVGMPDEVYHSIPRLSSSGVRNLNVSPMTFWCRSWMNAAREKAETVFTAKGKAYHARICEGRELFERRYDYGLRLSDYPDALVNTDDIKTWIRTYNDCHPIKLALGGNKPELIERILGVDPAVEIWDALVAAHLVKLKEEGRTMLDPEWRDDLERAAAYIEKHPTISKCFTGGEPEVTILWTHKHESRDGSGRIVETPMKCRIDRLKPSAVVDLKTYGNPLDKPPLKAVYSAMASGRYHMQTAIYLRAVDAAVAAGWLAQPAQPHQFVFVFQGTGDDPTPIARILDRASSWVTFGWTVFDDACETFHKFIASHGSDPWIVDSPIEQFGDDDIPQWAAD